MSGKTPGGSAGHVLLTGALLLSMQTWLWSDADSCPVLLVPCCLLFIVSMAGGPLATAVMHCPVAILILR